MFSSQRWRRRPSASMAVALIALFTSLGGVGYAATQLPANSVGRAQIRNNAVNYQKIAPRSVGIARINPHTVQARVLNTCNQHYQPHTAMTAIDQHGQPTCTGVLPTEFDTSTAKPVSLAAGSAPTTVAAEPLSGQTSYLVLANPYIEVSGAAGSTQHVEVACALAADPLPGQSQPRSATFDLAPGQESERTSIPLSLTETGNSGTDTVSLSCRYTTAGAATPADVEVSTTINALQTFGNTARASTAR